MNLARMRDLYMDDGLGFDSASARACQDAFLTMVAASDFADKVTFKGGVVMQQVSGDLRRATQDIDFDFMRHSIADRSIRAFIAKVNKGGRGVRIRIDGPIEKLKHQDYDGKRVHIVISDGEGNSINTKLDIGVHKDLSIRQRSICFDVMSSDAGVSLLANSGEQLVAEKLKSLLRLGARSTRYKDVFDIYYQVKVKGVDRSGLDECVGRYIFEDEGMREVCWGDVYRRLESVLEDKRFVRNLSNAKNNWLDLSVQKVTKGILSYVAGCAR